MRTRGYGERLGYLSKIHPLRPGGTTRASERLGFGLVMGLHARTKELV